MQPPYTARVMPLRRDNQICTHNRYAHLSKADTPSRSVRPTIFNFESIPPMTTSTAHQDLRIVKIGKGETVFRQQDKGEAAYVVSAGAIAIYREVDGQQIPLATVQPGGAFGEMAVIDGSPRMATAVALEDTTLTVVSAQALKQKLTTADPLISIVVQMLMTNLRNVHALYMPQPRTLADVVAILARQGSVMKGLLENKANSDLKTALATELNAIGDRISMVRILAEDLKDVEARRNAIPSAAELPRRPH